MENQAGGEKRGILAREDGASIAYRTLPGKSPGIVFIGGFRSDMTGSKAESLAAFCAARGQAYLRFDHFAHGASPGRWDEATIGRWAADLVAVLDELTEGPQILVGSSMGGWLMLLAAKARPERVAALVGIAAAPDFTEDLMWAGFPEAQKAALLRNGRITLASEYDPVGYVVTRRLIEEGREQLVLRDPLPITCPVRLLHGLRDPDVPWQTSLRLAEHIAGRDVAVTLLKDGDHRLATAADLALLHATLEALL
ncbi:MAG: alpha/beta hydrolase [Rhodospirillales bacterium]|nr:alpha/beta hydrolase [Rhodospirillales bacterium]